MLHHLVLWAKGIHEKVQSSTELTKALSPLDGMPQNARDFLHERIVQGTGTEAFRRQRALDWVDELWCRRKLKVEALSLVTQQSLSIAEAARRLEIGQNRLPEEERP